MKPIFLALAAAACVAPMAANAAGACDQVNGTYVDGRAGTLQGTSMIAFDRLVLNKGAGNGDQVLTTPNGAGANHILLRTTCTPLTANTARLSIDSMIPGNGWSSAGSVVLTILDGGNRIWFRGETAGAEFPGWLLRVPAPM
jgi:hypothetical protein